MVEEPRQSFLDSKTIMAIILVGVSWIGWQWYMQKKYPEAYRRKSANPPVEQTAERTNETVAPSLQGSVATPSKNDEVAEPKAAAPESLLHFEDKNWSFDVSSKGMGLKDITLKKYLERNKDPKRLAYVEEGVLPFTTNIIGRKEPLDFQMRKVSENEFVGQAQLGAMTVTKTMKVNSDSYIIDTSVVVKDADKDFAGLNTYVTSEMEKYEKGSFFLPQYEHQEFYVSYDDSSERLLIDETNPVQENYSKVKLVAIGSQYFALALLDQSPVMPEVKTYTDLSSRFAVGEFTYNVLNRGSDFSVAYKSFAGPKSQELLSGIDKSLAGIINFGWFGWIGNYILKLMQLFHSLVGNWGIAIILLTLLVRTLLLPFNIMSYKSMKGMQAIQPHLKSIRERFKDDPQRANQETLALMREHKVNPMGGCLPVLLQFPVFLALYQVLGQSIELYQAPFILWIQDLSLKDPYYVLPVLVAITMFIQMKVTPSTMDPAQQKVMMFLPVIFSVFMLTLPSGLNLYILVSTLFGVSQHFYFMRDKSTAKAA